MTTDKTEIKRLKDEIRIILRTTARGAGDSVNNHLRARELNDKINRLEQEDFDSQFAEWEANDGSPAWIDNPILDMPTRNLYPLTMTNIINVTVNAEWRTLVFNGNEDSRYKFPVWAAMSRNPRVFYTDPITGKEEVLSGPGTMEVLQRAGEHYVSLNA